MLRSLCQLCGRLHRLHVGSPRPHTTCPITLGLAHWHIRICMHCVLVGLPFRVEEFGMMIYYCTNRTSQVQFGTKNIWQVVLLLPTLNCSKSRNLIVRGSSVGAAMTMATVVVKKIAIFESLLPTFAHSQDFTVPLPEMEESLTVNLV